MINKKGRMIWTVIGGVIALLILVIIVLAATGQLRTAGKALSDNFIINLVSRNNDLKSFDSQSYTDLTIALNACLISENCYCDYDFPVFAKGITIGFERESQTETNVVLYLNNKELKRESLNSRVSFMSPVDDKITEDTIEPDQAVVFKEDSSFLAVKEGNFWNSYSNTYYSDLKPFYIVKKGELILIQNDRVDKNVIDNLEICSDSPEDDPENPFNQKT
jgi:hypothetical protein